MAITLVRAREVQADDAADHQDDAGELERTDRLADGRHADHRDRGGAHGDDDQGREQGPGEAVGEAQEDGPDDLGRDRRRQIDPRQHDVYKCTRFCTYVQLVRGYSAGESRGVTRGCQASEAGQIKRKSHQEQISGEGVGSKSWPRMPSPTSRTTPSTRSRSSGEPPTATFSSASTYQ